jgi:hypothetical protein
MTFFSLIALAFGMMAAAADAAVPRAAFASVTIERRASRRLRAHGAATARIHVPAVSRKKPLFRRSPLRRIVAPLSGSLTPRAPGC